MNDVGYYVGLLSDQARLDAFEVAIREAVRPGDRVLEIGTGLGTFAFMAAAAGAGEVVTVESGPVLHLAETLGAANGLGDRVRFVRGTYPDGVEIEGRFDVVIFEDFSTTFLDENTVRVIRAAIDRHLKPGGRILPESVRFGAVPVSADLATRGVFRGVSAERFAELRLDGTLLRSQLASTPIRVNLGADDPLSRPWHTAWHAVAELVRDGAPDLDPGWAVDSEAEVGGVAVWFEFGLVGEATVSNAPGPAGVWGQRLFPADPPLSVHPGQLLTARISRDHDPERLPGWFNWELACGQEVRHGHEFAGALIDPLELTEGRDSHIDAGTAVPRSSGTPSGSPS